MSLQNNINLDAKKILLINDKGNYTIPTDGLYPFQWNWDSAFAAYGFAQFDIPRAWKELETLFSAQWNNGMVPHIIYHQIDDSYFPGPSIWKGIGPIPSSGITQPPVVASLMKKIWQLDTNYGNEQIRLLFPKVLKWHRWFMKWRFQEGLVFINHPWEAGRDNAPDWDSALSAINPSGVAPYKRRDTEHVNPLMRPTKSDYDRYIWLVQQGRECKWNADWLRKNSSFKVADPAMHFILLRANRDLRLIGINLEEDISEIDSWIASLEKGASKLWNTSISSYDSFDLLNFNFAGSISSASFMCWYAGLYDKRMLTHYDRIMKKVKYGMPSYDPESKRFDRKRYWRGPSWAIMNMLIGFGLEEVGEVKRASLLKAQTNRAISENGFAEYFDPIDGSPAGGNTFTWTAAVWLGWAKTLGGTNGFN